MGVRPDRRVTTAHAGKRARRLYRLHHRDSKVVASLPVLLAFLAGSAGCLSEHSFRLDPAQVERISLAADTADAGNSTRTWLASAHADLEKLLPAGAPRALLTNDLATGESKSVYKHFKVNPKGLRTLLGNAEGLRCTAQGASQAECIDQRPPEWPGFDDVWIPIPGGPSLSGRLGFAMNDDGPQTADCIIILPGLLGDNGVLRTRDLATFLRDSGLHVLALELRGHGQTEAAHPESAYTFGVIETDDLVLVADWLQELPQVNRTGLVGFCWGANLALLASWYEGRPQDDPSILPDVTAALRSDRDRRRFEAGVIAFSPIVHWERLVDELETPRAKVDDPICASLQATVASRVRRKGYNQPRWSLSRLIESEYQRGPLNSVASGCLFLRLAPYRDRPCFDKLEAARTPVLIVHAANDPLSAAQDVADFVAGINNARVAAVLLPSGGHVGFAAYAKTYYFSLIRNFFDPVVGAAAGYDNNAAIVAAGSVRSEIP